MIHASTDIPNDSMHTDLLCYGSNLLELIVIGLEVVLHSLFHSSNTLSVYLFKFNDVEVPYSVLILTTLIS